MYHCKGFTGIEVLLISTGGPAWHKTRIFDVTALVKAFDLPNLSGKGYFRREWLIQNEIPQGHVSRVSFGQMMAQCSKKERKQVRAEYKKNHSKKRKRPAEVEAPQVSLSRPRRQRTRKYAKVNH